MQHVEALAVRFAALATDTRSANAAADELGDADTADLFTEVSRGLDKSLWFLESHLQECHHSGNGKDGGLRRHARASV